MFFVIQSSIKYIMGVIVSKEALSVVKLAN